VLSNQPGLKKKTGTCIGCLFWFIGHGKEAQKRVKGLVLGVIVSSVTDESGVTVQKIFGRTANAAGTATEFGRKKRGNARLPAVVVRRKRSAGAVAFWQDRMQRAVS
jgi:hypothetical protein